MAEKAGITDQSDQLVYAVKECILYFKDRQQKVETGDIHAFGIGCNYSGEEVFPEFTISLGLDRKTFFNVMSEKDTVTMLLKVVYFVNNPSSGEEADKGRERVWFNEKFVIYMDDQHFDIMLNQESEMKKEFQRTGDDKSDIPQHKEYNLDLFLYKEADIDTAYSVTNKVIKTADKNTLVTYLLNQSKAKKVLMSPLVHNVNVHEIILPPITMVNSLKYLVSQYGLHSHGTLIFFDLDYLFILNKKMGCTAWQKGELTKTVFVIREDTDEHSFMGGTRLNAVDKIAYINVSPENITYHSYSSLDSLIYGDRVNSIDAYGATTTVLTSKGKSRKIHDRYLHNKYRNKVVNAGIQQELNDRGLVASINIVDGNINWFRPNKEFRFVFKKTALEKILGGRYKLLSLYMKFTNYGEYFRNETSINFSKEI